MGTLAKAKFEKDMQARSEEVKVGTGRWNFIGRRDGGCDSRFVPGIARG